MRLTLSNSWNPNANLHMMMNLQLLLLVGERLETVANLLERHHPVLLRMGRVRRGRVRPLALRGLGCPRKRR